MKVGRIFISFVMLLLAFYKADAQIIKAFSSTDVADNYRVELKGDKTSKINFKWTSADLKKPNVNFVYSFQLDTIGAGFNNPWSVVNEQCCANFFNDTIMDITLEYLAGEIDYVLNKKYKKRFKIGDSITLEWIIMCNAAGPNATYENRQTQTKTITFVRGQFDTEYVPIKLHSPLDNSSFFVEDNANVKLKFQWTKAYCPTGCNAPQYRIMFDNLSGDFSNPLYFFDIPVSSFDTLYDLRQDVLTRMMYDEGIPINTPKTYKWTVEVFGNGEQFFALAPKRISLLRGLMKFENTPFYLEQPVDNAVFKVEKNTNDSIVFSWNKTKSGFPNSAKYNILFSNTTNVDFSAPLFSFNTNFDDTSYFVRYGVLRDSLDKIYGKNWTTQDLKWAVEADIVGYKFLSNDTNDIRIARGFFTNVKENKALQVKVYPNPTTKNLNIELPSESAVDRIEICDALGRIVLNTTINPNSRNLYFNTESFTNGVYFIRLHQNNRAISPIAFIKQ